MLDAFIDILGSVPHWLATILLAAVPIGELRAAIPVAAHVWLVNPFDAYLFAVIGNLLPFFPLYFGLEWARDQLSRIWPWFAKVIDGRLQHAEEKVQKKYAQYGAFALFLFTAIPLPFTGLYTATLAAIALKIPFKQAFIGIASGVVTAGIIVSILSISGEVFF